MQGNNVYKGFRYVPKNEGDWIKDNSYEALTVVQYQGNSYTSKVCVPRGIDILDTRFWIQTANYNQQFENLRDTFNTTTAETIKELNDFKNKQDNEFADLLQSHKDNVNAYVDEMSKELENERAEINAGGLTELNNNFNSFKNTVDSQFNEKAKKIFITPEEFGAVGDGVANDTLALQLAINYATTNNVALWSDKRKIYGINSTLTISDELDIDFNGATIKAISSISDMISIDNSQYLTDYITGQNHYNRINNIKLDCNSLATNGLRFVYGGKFDISKIKIRNLTGTGIKIDAGYEILFNVVDIVGDGSNETVGIEINTSDCHFTNIIMNNCHTSIKNNGTNFYTGVHSWLTTNFYQSIFFLHLGGNPILEQCYSDTYYISIKKKTGSRLSINQLTVSFNTVLYTTSSCNYSPYVFYFENISDTTTNATYSRFTCINNSIIACHKDIATYITNLDNNTSFIQSLENNFIYSNGIYPIDFNQNNTSKMVLESIASDNDVAKKLINSIKIRDGKALCELKLYFSGGIAPDSDILVGHILSPFAKFTGDKMVGALLTDGAWGGPNSGMGIVHFTSATNGSIYIRHNLGFTPTYLSVSFEYEVGYYA